MSANEAPLPGHLARYFLPLGILPETGIQDFEAAEKQSIVYPAEDVIEFNSRVDYAGVVSGWVCRRHLSGDKKRQIVSFFFPGDVISPSVNEHPSSKTNIVTLTDARLLRFQDTIGNGLKLAKRDAQRLAVKSITSELGHLTDQIIGLGLKSATNRLLHLMASFRRRLPSNSVSFIMPLNQAVLADALGITVVHTNRILQQLRREGKLSIRDQRVTLPD